jgi:hypothetical protein
LPAGAQQSVTLEFSAGKVTLNAQNAPVRAILAEWARLGGATIVNGDRVVGPPVTLQLTSVSERQALDVVLRGVSGYMAAPRAAGSSGASVFDRIVILPVSVAPRNPPPAAAAAGRPGLQRPPILVRPTPPDELPDDAEQADQNGGDEIPLEEPANVQPRQGDPRVRPPILLPADPNTADIDDVEQPDNVVPAVQPTPANPFGIPAGSSATPGVVTPLPQGQQRPGPARVQ